MNATDKQLVALEKFSKNSELKKLFENIDLKNISRKDASKLMEECIKQVNEKAATKLKNVIFSANYKNGNGWKSVMLTDAELESIRGAHKRHCEKIIDECHKEYPESKLMALAMFEKRADKVFTWIQQALDMKIRQRR